MKNIIIVLQRLELNYLIKYNSLRTSSDRIIDFYYEDFKKLRDQKKANILHKSTPIYEQDHEVLLIEYNPNIIGYNNGPLLNFKGIHSIIPLTETAERLFSSKLNTDFKILPPLDPLVYRSFINYRSHILRYEAGKQLCTIYKVKIPNKEFITEFKTATLFQLNNQKPNTEDSTLAHLIDFNVTPSFIPEGNIEAIIKSACVGMKKLGKDVDQITKSTFYSFANKEKSKINSKTLYEAINYIQNTTDFDQEEKARFDKLKNTLSENDKYKDAFLLFSYFYFLKKQIERHNYDISIPKDEILELKHYHPESISKVLFMLGYTFSIQTISHSIQSFSQSKLLKTKNNLDLNWAPTNIDENLVEQKKDEINNSKFSDSEIEKIKKPDQDNYPLEDEKTLEIELSVEKDPVKIISEDESVSNENDDNFKNSLFPNEKNFGYNKNDLINEEELCSFENFKSSIGSGKFADKVIEALELKKENGKISKQTLIACLKETDHYLTKSGKTSSNAKKALRIFDEKKLQK